MHDLTVIQVLNEVAMAQHELDRCCLPKKGYEEKITAQDVVRTIKEVAILKGVSPIQILEQQSKG